ncbi:patj homolog [Anopheles bellator]|uniref:patj homolog n=1 Tax=Anopheles bellator TaxID=139047 RepID=UPI002647E8DF|nr:patj homolog [Anopheles bellator]
MVLSTEWSQVEIIDLINDGNGLGFMLVGGRSTGVVIKALIPGSVAERDGRLQSGDHVLQIGEVNLRGFNSEQVATVLRQSGQQVRLIVARSVEPTSPDYKALASHAPIIPTKMLTDPDELDRTLLQTAGYTPGVFLQSSASIGSAFALDNRTNCPTHIEVVAVNHRAFEAASCLETLALMGNGRTASLVSGNGVVAHHHSSTIIQDGGGGGVAGSVNKELQHECTERQAETKMTPESPETETYEVELHKNVYGLGITVAGYVCEEEDLSGIFVKSIIEGSAAEVSGRIAINDRIVAVDGRSLAGVTNHQAVELLRNTGIVVRLMLERFLRGRKYEHLQVALIDPSSKPCLTTVRNKITPPVSCQPMIERGYILNGGVDSGANDHAAESTAHITELSHSQHSLSHCLSQCTSLRCSIMQSPSVTTLSICPARSDADSVVTECGVEPELESGSTFDSSVFVLENGSELSFGGCGGVNGGNDSKSRLNGEEYPSPDTEGAETLFKNGVTALALSSTLIVGPIAQSPLPAPTNGDSSGSCGTPTTAGAANRRKSGDDTDDDLVLERWSREIPQSQIVMADIRKLAGLGISLEGTVEVECGVELRPHHYIRSILEDGPVGRNGSLKPGDELLQVNEHRLQGLRHIEVVKILKELPAQVRVICARGSSPPTVINTSRNAEAFEARSLLAGGLQSLQYIQGILTKAQSESSLYTSSTATLTDQQRSKSMEQVSGLALWTSDVLYCDIEKTERGFGFSILDYQDPLDTDGTVIVVRGLIPGGSAEATNFIFPGDRLVSVNGHSLQSASLDQAVSVLKGIPLGTACIGLSRPLSASDNNLSSAPETPTA